MENMSEKKSDIALSPVQCQPATEETDEPEQDEINRISRFQYRTQSAQASNFVRSKRQLITIYVV